MPSLPDEAVLLDVFRAYPEIYRPLMDYHQAPLRGPSPLSVAERDLIAAYVSALKACRYCHGVHPATAQAFGIGDGTLAALLADVSAAPAPGPLMRYVGKLTVSPGEDHRGGCPGGAGCGVGRCTTPCRCAACSTDEPAG